MNIWRTDAICLMWSFQDLVTRSGFEHLCEVKWIYDISVICDGTYRCAGGLRKKLDLRSGSKRHRHFVGFFNTDTGPTFLYVYSKKPPLLVAFNDTLGIRRTHSRLNPRVLSPHGGGGIYVHVHEKRFVKRSAHCVREIFGGYLHDKTRCFSFRVKFEALKIRSAFNPELRHGQVGHYCINCGILLYRTSAQYSDKIALKGLHWI